MTVVVARRGRILDMLLAVVVVALLGIYAVVLPVFLPPPVGWLPSGPPGDMTAIVAARYPNGSTEKWVEATLTAEGFRPERPYPRYDHAFVIDRGGFPCNHTWLVMWRSQPDGTVVAITGYLKETCI